MRDRSGTPVQPASRSKRPTPEPLTLRERIASAMEREPDERIRAWCCALLKGDEQSDVTSEKRSP